MHRLRPLLQRHASRIESRGRRADHRHRLAAQRGEIDRIGGMGTMRRRQPDHRRRVVRTAIAADTVCQHDFARRFYPGRKMQAKMVAGRLDPIQARVVMDLDPEELLEPRQIGRPIGPANAVDRRVGGLPVARFVPRLETQSRQTDFRPR